MALITIFVELEADGVPLEGFPYVRRLEVDDLQAFGPYEHEGVGPGIYHTLPVTRLGVVEGLVVAPSKTLCVKLNGQFDGELVIFPDGVLVCWETELDHSPITNVTGLAVDPATFVKGVAAGIGIESANAAVPEPGSGFGEGGIDEQPFGGSP